ncbi:MAG: type I CRISPR-associated protein Cas7 [Thermomicrobiales bacterium]|nr:type I CRISPR-associated protein Cas7 [Thermomicrobiales bacterium]
MNAPFNRGTGLLVINVVNSNPNGDPDQESEPRTFEGDLRGLISPVSFKRKLRDLMENPDGIVRQAALAAVGEPENASGYEILERRGRNRAEINAMSNDEFIHTYWDARVFGNTFLEKDDGSAKLRTGVVQIGPGVSVAPVEIMRMTNTNKAGVEADKDRGMAPLGFRVVRHGLYTMPFFVNASAARKSGCTARDIELLKFLLPYAYSHTASAIRPQVDVVHAWYAEHKNPLGSCPDPLLLAALKPHKRKELNPEKPSHDLDDYKRPEALPDDLRARLAAFEDLTTRIWSA